MRPLPPRIAQLLRSAADGTVAQARQRCEEALRALDALDAGPSDAEVDAQLRRALRRSGRARLLPLAALVMGLAAAAAYWTELQSASPAAPPEPAPAAPVDRRPPARWGPAPDHRPAPPPARPAERAKQADPYGSRR